MFDINQLKHKIQHGGIALSEALEQRVLNDEITEKDYEFLKRAFGDMRDLTKKIKNGEPIHAYEECYYCESQQAVTLRLGKPSCKECNETKVSTSAPLHTMTEEAKASMLKFAIRFQKQADKKEEMEGK